MLTWAWVRLRIMRTPFIIFVDGTSIPELNSWGGSLLKVINQRRVFRIPSSVATLWTDFNISDKFKSLQWFGRVRESEDLELLSCNSTWALRFRPVGGTQVWAIACTVAHCIIWVDEFNDGWEDRVAVREAIVNTLVSKVFVEDDAQLSIVILPHFETNLAKSLAQSLN